MKKIYRLAFLFFVLTFLSCEKVINLNYSETTSKYVIEGIISNESGNCKVKISNSKDFDEDNNFKGLSGATVEISNLGHTYTLPEAAPGIYQNNLVKGIPGQTYKLSVKISDQLYTATSRMPVMAVFENIYIAKGDFDPKSAVVTVRFKDALNAKNYYWFQQYINSIKQRNFAVLKDESPASQEVLAFLNFRNTNEDVAVDLKKGDRLVVAMHNIDESVYKYLENLYNASGKNNSTIPANPESNLSGGALGYFSAQSTQLRMLIIP